MRVTVSLPRRDGVAHATTEVPIDQVYVIWSYEHNAWWGAAYGGYWVNILHAGLYTKEAAEAECGRRYRGMQRDEEARRLLDVLPKERALTGNTVFSIVDAFIARELEKADPMATAEQLTGSW